METIQNFKGKKFNLVYYFLIISTPMRLEI